MTATAAVAGSDDGHLTGFGTKGYRAYVLFTLLLVYTLNFIDRTVITVVSQPIIDTFSLTDTQWGLLTGPPFAIFYALMGIPIAMWADKGNRVFIISLCIVVWSLMTAFCGLAASFLWLLLFRIGVAIGEAGCTPPANSIITDYFRPQSRANAIGIYSMGVTIGGVLAQLFGGTLAGLKGETFGGWMTAIGLSGLFQGLDWSQVEGWRLVFIIVGLPGVLLAVVLMLTVREPPRGYSDPKGAAPPRKAGLAEAFREFSTKPTFWTLSLGAAFVAFVGYGLIAFQAPFLMRVHGLSVVEAAVNYGAPLAAVAAFGTFMGGWLSERLTPRFPNVVAWLPAVGLLIAIPTYILAFLSQSLTIAFALWVVAAIAHYAYLGSQYSVATAIVSPQARATTVSVLLLIVSLIGNGLGSMFTGSVSSFFFGRILAGQGLTEAAATFEPKLCGARIAELGEAGPALCGAYGEGLRWAMIATVMFFLAAAAFYLLAARTYQKDRWRAA